MMPRMTPADRRTRVNARVSMSEIPLAIGLFAVSPGALIVAKMAGHAADGLRRKIPLYKATFNVALVDVDEGFRMMSRVEDIDRGMMLGYKFPTGPLKLTDLVGLDVRYLRRYPHRDRKSVV